MYNKSMSFKQISVSKLTWLRVIPVCGRPQLDSQPPDGGGALACALPGEAGREAPPHTPSGAAKQELASRVSAEGLQVDRLGPVTICCASPRLR